MVEISSSKPADQVHRVLLLLVANLALVGLGCLYTVVDLAVTIQFKLEIHDVSTGDRISGAKVSFIDVGLDEWLGKGSKELLVGHSNLNGELIKEFSYSYGYTEGRPRFRPGEFMVKVEQEGCKESNTVFNLGDLSRVSGNLLLESSVGLDCSSELSEVRSLPGIWGRN